MLATCSCRVGHVLVLATLSAGILIVFSITTQHRVVHALVEREAELVGTLTKSSVFFLKKCGRVEEAKAEIHELASTTPGIESIRILTTEGSIFSSTVPEEKAAMLPDKDRAVIRSLVAERTQRTSVMTRKQRTIRSFMLVENGPACYSCHDAGRRINGVLEVVLDYREASNLVWKSQWKAIVPAVLSLGLLIFVILRLFERLINRSFSLHKDRMKMVQEGDLDTTTAVIERLKERIMWLSPFRKR